MSRAFTAYTPATGFIAQLDRKFPSFLSGWRYNNFEKSYIPLSAGCTHYGYVHSGWAVVRYQNLGLRIKQGMYFCLPGEGEVIDFDGMGIVVSREEFNGMFMVGGPCEQKGRLRYIDGCTDSLLIPPVMMGDPCLNLLYFPEGIDQTEHTHPSDRIGIIMSGHGMCHHRDAPGDNVQLTYLEPGTIFCIHTDGLHRFSTLEGDEMRVLAYHPDSDFGPTHEFHPMLNRTIIEGKSAASSEREQFRTKV